MASCSPLSWGETRLPPVAAATMPPPAAAAGSGGGETAAEKVLTAAKMLSYWKSNHDRVKGQVVVNTDEDVSVIIPMVRPCRICGKHP